MKMKKSVILCLILGILFFSFVFSVWIVSAQVTTPASPDPIGKFFEWIKGSLSKTLNVWKDPSDGSTKPDDALMKILFLCLVVLLIYSALAYANFPDSFGGGSGFVRFLLSLVTGILATLYITPKEVFSLMQSYTALGVALITFFPIMILLFFTIVVARKASPIGIFSQKLLWLGYSLYLFFRSLIITILVSTCKVDTASKSLTCDKSGVFASFVEFFYRDTTYLNQIVTSGDTMISFVTLIVAIGVFVIFVLSGKPVVAWMQKEARDAEIESQKMMLERSHAYDKARAEQMQKT
jgi:hypothetical protein